MINNYEHTIDDQSIPGAYTNNDGVSRNREMITWEIDVNQHEHVNEGGGALGTWSTIGKNAKFDVHGAGSSIMQPELGSFFHQ